MCGVLCPGNLHCQDRIVLDFIHCAECGGNRRRCGHVPIFDPGPDLSVASLLFED